MKPIRKSFDQLTIPDRLFLFVGMEQVFKGTLDPLDEYLTKV